MIAFDLRCHNDHVFEGWFEDSAAYEDQKQKGLLTCPFCDSPNIDKIPTTFGIVKSTAAPVLGSKQIDQLADKLIDFIDNHFEDVGSTFTKEALKIHYGVSEPRNIKGTSTPEENKILEEEGIKTIRIPIPHRRVYDA